MGQGRDITISVKQLNAAAALPQYMTAGAAGMDVCAVLPEPVTLAPLARALIPTGLALAIPEGFEVQVRPRSGLAAKHGVTVLNAPGTIDADYRGEVKVLLVNLSNEPFVINPGERIAQIVCASVVQATLAPVKELPETARGAGGFGHTGR
jgi:dUTP pyrophosphatase